MQDYERTEAICEQGAPSGEIASGFTLGNDALTTLEATMRIVRAKESHVVGITEVWKEFMDYHQKLDSHFSRRPDGHVNFENWLRGLLKREDALVLIATDAGRVVGYSISVISQYPPVFVRETYGHINDMAVRAGYRRKGIGEQMLVRILEWFKSKDIDRIELSVAVGNKIGNSFWRKHGFKDYMFRLYLRTES